ncbi:hypothetical protein ABU178_18770 [Pantoea osteomyelitidis]|uniref:Uncharacterized protein n=1 Tax=Pantoea osteomyelitidis TaxID=3230026 RepID=A0ABW7Q0U4_9GAMM
MSKIKRVILSSERELKKIVQLPKIDVQIVRFMQHVIVSGPGSTPMSKQYPECYPWCFLLADRKENSKNIFLGALATLFEKHEKTVFLSYLSLNSDEARRNLLSAHHLAFWQARILALLVDNEDSGINKKMWREWTVSLQRSLSPFREKLLIKPEFCFDYKKSVLLSPCCKTDFDLMPDAGVENMPWKAWPQVIRKSNESWLWRQNRQARIIDCQKVAFQ